MPAILSKVSVKFPCNLCCKPVAKNHHAICCDICDQWVHIKCNNVSPADYELLKSSGSPWFCVKCIGCVFPRATNLFDDVMPSVSDDLDEVSESNSLNSSDTLTNSTPGDDSSKAVFLNSLLLPESPDNSDDDHDESIDPPLNCCYYDSNSLAQVLRDSPKISNSFFHLNIASLPLHSDELNSLLHSLDHQFSVIGITETKISSPTIPKSLAISDYHYLHTPSMVIPLWILWTSLKKSAVYSILCHLKINVLFYS